MIAIDTFALEPVDAAHAALFDAACAAADAAQTLVETEEQDPEQVGGDDIQLPPIAVVDEEGRPITAVRLEREPGTMNFRIVLVAERTA